ncbi:MAG: serine hydrolase [Acidobacteriota bacterium]
MFEHQRAKLLFPLLLFLACAVPGTAQRFDGVWRAQEDFGPRLVGELRIELTEGEAGTAQIGGRQAKLERTVTGIAAEFGEGSSFRGDFTEDGTIRGVWIQATGVSFTYPHAAPLVLEKNGKDRWRGQVPVVDDAITFFLKVETDDEGKQHAFLRNPERNLGIFLRIATLQHKNGKVALLSEDGSERMTGRYDLGNEVLSLYSDQAGQTFDFYRMADVEGSDFAAALGTGRGTDRAPEELGDGWEVAKAADSLDVEPLDTLISELRADVADSVFSRYVHSLQIAHRGRLVVDEYFYGNHEATPHDTRSAGKSVTSVVAGAAKLQGADLSLDTDVHAVFGREADDPPLLLRHLLTMSPGWACDDDDGDSPGNEGTMQYQTEQPDWWAYSLDLERIAEPGANDVYCSGSINLAYGVVSKVAGRPLPELLRDLVAEPLEIDTFFMNLDPLERGYGGGGLRMRPRDLLKFGQLMVDDGVWKGRRILSSEWVKESLRPHSSLNVPDDYGLAWWRIAYDVDGREIQAYYASGNGGQLIFAVPALELSVLFTAGNYNNFGTWRSYRDELMPDYILPAVLGAPGTAEESSAP